MRRLLLSLTVLLALTACGSPSLRYRLSLRAEDPAKRAALVTAALHVVTNRLSRLSTEPASITQQQEGTGALLSLVVPDQKIADELTQELLRPFSLMLMLKSLDATGDVQVENVGAFTATDVTEKEVSWVEAGTTTTGKNEVAIGLTAEGQKRVDALFKSNQGRSIGLFVRGQLMSILPLSGASPGEKLIITGIPSAAIAAIFADDVNVGTHVTFSVPR